MSKKTLMTGFSRFSLQTYKPKRNNPNQTIHPFIHSVLFANK